MDSLSSLWDFARVVCYSYPSLKRQSPILRALMLPSGIPMPIPRAQVLARVLVGVLNLALVLVLAQVLAQVLARVLAQALAEALAEALARVLAQVLTQVPRSIPRDQNPPLHPGRPRPRGRSNLYRPQGHQCKHPTYLCRRLVGGSPVRRHSHRRGRSPLCRLQVGTHRRHRHQ